MSKLEDSQQRANSHLLRLLLLMTLFISKANHSISQKSKFYAPTSNAEEAEIEQFCEDLQGLLELTPQKVLS